MAVEVIDGVEHIYAPNPKLQGQHWEAEYPPIQTTSQWLINKYTGEILPNTPEFARRSDILEPYFGELDQTLPDVSQTTTLVNTTLKQAEGDLASL